MFKPKKLSSKNFLSSLDVSKEELINILELAEKFKNEKTNIDFGKKVLGLVFDKSSTRTRVSFQVAMFRLGGTTIDLNALLDLENLAVGIGIVAFFFIVRFVFLKLFFLKKSILPELLITPRGLITVLLFFSIPEELSSLTFNSDIILITIIVTSLVMTWGLIKFGKEGLEEGAPAPLEDSRISYFLQRMSSNTSRTKDAALAEQVEDALEEIQPDEDVEGDSETGEAEEDKPKD